MRIDRIKLVSELARRDMNTLQLANKSGVSRCTISGIRCGRSCYAETADKLARALDVSVEFLTENSSNKPKEA